MLQEVCIDLRVKWNSKGMEYLLKDWLTKRIRQKMVRRGAGWEARNELSGPSSTTSAAYRIETAVNTESTKQGHENTRSRQRIDNSDSMQLCNQLWSFFYLQGKHWLQFWEGALMLAIDKKKHYGVDYKKMKTTKSINFLRRIRRTTTKQSYWTQTLRLNCVKKNTSKLVVKWLRTHRCPEQICFNTDQLRIFYFYHGAAEASIIGTGRQQSWNLLERG